MNHAKYELYLKGNLDDYIKKWNKNVKILSAFVRVLFIKGGAHFHSQYALRDTGGEKTDISQEWCKTRPSQCISIKQLRSNREKYFTTQLAHRRVTATIPPDWKDSTEEERLPLLNH